MPHKKATQRELVFPSGLTPPGDSGSVVVLSDTGEAVGMVVGGSRLSWFELLHRAVWQDMQSVCRDVIHPAATAVVIDRIRRKPMAILSFILVGLAWD